MRRTSTRGVVALLAAAVAFGTTFGVVQDAVADAEPFPFLGARFLVGTLALAPFALGRVTPGLWRDGAAAGGLLASAYVAQTVGLQYTTTQASAFLTYLLIIVVPVAESVLLRRMPGRARSMAVALALGGAWLLTGVGGVGFGRGELLTVACALTFGLHVIVVARVVDRHDVLALNAVQLAVVAAVCLPVGAVSGGFSFGPAAWWAALYTGVVASALAFAGQLYGQRTVGPTRAALLLLVEPVSAAVIGFARGERLDTAGWVGATAILAAVAVSEVVPDHSTLPGPGAGTVPLDDGGTHRQPATP